MAGEALQGRHRGLQPFDENTKALQLLVAGPLSQLCGETGVLGATGSGEGGISAGAIGGLSGRVCGYVGCDMLYPSRLVACGVERAYQGNGFDFQN